MAGRIGPRKLPGRSRWGNNLRRFFGGRKPPAAEPVEKKTVPKAAERKMPIPVKKLTSREAAKEAARQMELEMTAEAARQDFFAAACKRVGLNPKLVFLELYKRMQQVEEISKRELKVEDDREKEGRTFDTKQRTRFYAKLIANELLPVAAGAVKITKFVDFCRSKGLDPASTFLLNYIPLAYSGKVRELEAKQKAKLEKAGRQFSKAGFYAAVIRAKLSQPKK